jgi:AraC family transcriptional regulator of arabinose operon
LPELATGFTLVHFADADRLGEAVAAFERVFRHAMLSSRDTPHGRILRHRHSPAATAAGHLALNGIEEIILLAVIDQELTQQRGLDPRIQRVLDAISTDFSTPMSLDALARLISLSPSRLSHLFRVETGDSVTNVICTMRLREAARLLKTTDQSIARIADEVGFSSPYYFSRQFRSRYEMSPREFRNQSRDS